ncbi:hypothetical protein 2 [Hubei tombus-like virus 40]|uniref:hypothetical protein 2 n=1 Tax=Hubei tombus-like virus 40 TaxID=1923289 RepID=UPI00090BFD51|nr:hypothetical protein 2 [Hubei tombus-like virus 40]APG76317.1 hypothetical protein 2 [Hubei tombus-like virus 40]
MKEGGLYLYPWEYALWCMLSMLVLFGQLLDILSWGIPIVLRERGDAMLSGCALELNLAVGMRLLICSVSTSALLTVLSISMATIIFWHGKGVSLRSSWSMFIWESKRESEMLAVRGQDTGLLETENMFVVLLYKRLTTCAKTKTVTQFSVIAGKVVVIVLFASLSLSLCYRTPIITARMKNCAASSRGQHSSSTTTSTPPPNSEYMRMKMNSDARRERPSPAGKLPCSQKLVVLMDPTGTIYGSQRALLYLEQARSRTASLEQLEVLLCSLDTLAEESTDPTIVVSLRLLISELAHGCPKGEMYMEKVGCITWTGRTSSSLKRQTGSDQQETLTAYLWQYLKESLCSWLPQIVTRNICPTSSHTRRPNYTPSAYAFGEGRQSQDGWLKGLTNWLWAWYKTAACLLETPYISVRSALFTIVSSGGYWIDLTSSMLQNIYMNVYTKICPHTTPYPTCGLHEKSQRTIAKSTPSGYDSGACPA